MKTLVYLALICALASAPPIQAEDLPSLDETFDKDVLIIETADQGCFRFDVYLAITQAQQRRGLMFVRVLPEWTGMLFLYERAGVRSIWMKNTYIPLDILFARGDGTVSSIRSNAEPLSLKSMSAIEPINYVLELNGGTAERLSIKVGSRFIVERPD
jgi:uncharacterized membrane protein (UPF0127 family)